jgi:hypothetical protein
VRDAERVVLFARLMGGSDEKAYEILVGLLGEYDCEE